MNEFPSYVYYQNVDQMRVNKELEGRESQRIRGSYVLLFKLIDIATSLY